MTGFMPVLKTWGLVRGLSRLEWSSLIKLARNGGFVLKGLTRGERRRLQSFTKETWTFTHGGKHCRWRADKFLYAPLTRKFQEGYELTADGWKLIKEIEDAAQLAEEVKGALR